MPLNSDPHPENRCDPEGKRNTDPGRLHSKIGTVGTGTGTHLIHFQHHSLPVKDPAIEQSYRPGHNRTCNTCA